ncbi:DUF2807 domain-containing protein [Muricauda sp. JGD-17]|uniref:DUF2807 domain-containing protein n=1 Tax=Flagellimonas ochracea TaxID=2696472 RepID=A0A964TDA9_9FLAO|nr:DUF2807 domain-containing protein [Allomuricauda ochracea]NAY92790.1 DUF2807 domain-containing protein [Allomuricauda ochracea]
MKKILMLLFLVGPIVLTAQRKPKIKGSRVVSQVNEELPAFNAILLNDDLDIVLKKSFGPGYEIIADDNLIDILKFNVEDSTLVISSYYEVTAKKQFDITVNYTELKSITLKEGSILTMDRVESDELFVDGFGNSRLDIKARAEILDINLEDMSRGDFNVDADSLNISLNKRAQAYVYAVNEVSLLDLEGQSSITFEGTSQHVEARLTGYSKYKAENMETGTLKLMADKEADAKINVYQQLELTAKDRARINLYGNSGIIINEFTDSAQLIKKEE